MLKYKAATDNSLSSEASSLAGLFNLLSKRKRFNPLEALVKHLLAITLFAASIGLGIWGYFDYLQEARDRRSGRDPLIISSEGLLIASLLLSGLGLWTLFHVPQPKRFQSMNIPIDPSLADELQDASPSDQARAIISYFLERGGSNYEEDVTQLEHGLQCAHLARKNNASSTLVVAALLHDIGHLLLDENQAIEGFLSEDLCHETMAANYLVDFFQEAVLQPIRLHVPAKRYLCSIDPGYHDGLSRASKMSFQLQGGMMSDQELELFQQHAYLEDALTLRRWDDLAKVTGKDVAPLESYRDVLTEVLATGPA